MPASERRILIVDDEESIRELLTKAFEEAGYEPTCVASAEEALEMAKNNHFQVYFLDLLLPGMNGVELCRRIRKAKPTAFIFAMTGYASVFDLVQCREAGFDDYFPKPFKIQLLTQTAKESFAKLDRWRKGI